MSKAFSPARKGYVRGLGFAPWVKLCLGGQTGSESTILGDSHFRDGHLPPGSHSNLNQGGGKGDHLFASSLWLQGAVRTY